MHLLVYGNSRVISLPLESREVGDTAHAFKLVLGEKDLHGMHDVNFRGVRYRQERLVDRAMALLIEIFWLQHRSHSRPFFGMKEDMPQQERFRMHDVFL